MALLISCLQNVCDLHTFMKGPSLTIHFVLFIFYVCVHFVLFFMSVKFMNWSLLNGKLNWI